MKAILVGCEYVGKTTLAKNIAEWSDHRYGKGRGFHDHFSIPNEELSREARDHLQAAPPQLKEMFQRFMIAHHLNHGFYKGPDQSFVGFHIEEAVYAPLYYGYGGPDSGSSFRSPEGQRSQMARHVERELQRLSPDIVLILVTASPDVVVERMRREPHDYQVIKESDVPYLLQRFNEEYEQSIIEKKFVLNTTESTAKSTLEEFLQKFEPYWTEADTSATYEQDRADQIQDAGNSYL